ncbi:DUF1871 family protein [Aerolutibacter daejeonensis]|uniref:DUF1871 family protein n=1 Tax=Aerolutibacter daejeonensis TaxID=346181 RepID=UPI000A003DD8
MRTRKDYELALGVVGEAVRSWDPYALLSDGAPASEFEAEIATLAARVPHIHDATDAAQTVSDVFAEAFDSSLFTPAACAEVGAQLFLGLSRAGLVSGPNNSFKPKPLRGSA